jgi:hypothetical protein
MTPIHPESSPHRRGTPLDDYPRYDRFALYQLPYLPSTAALPFVLTSYEEAKTLLSALLISGTAFDALSLSTQVTRNAWTTPPGPVDGVFKGTAVTQLITLLFEKMCGQHTSPPQEGQLRMLMQLSCGETLAQTVLGDHLVHAPEDELVRMNALFGQPSSLQRVNRARLAGETLLMLEEDRLQRRFDATELMTYRETFDALWDSLRARDC